MAAAVAEAHRVMRRGGVLLAVQPTDQRPVLEVWQAPAGAAPLSDADAETARRDVLGPLIPDPDSRREFTATLAALAEAVDDSEAEAAFEPAAVRAFNYYQLFDSLDDLTDYLDDTPEFARAPDDLLERAAVALNGTPGQARLVIVQRTAVVALHKP